MSNRRYTPEFKDEAVRQVVERGCRVVEVAERLAVSANSLHKWVRAVKLSKTDEQAAELNDAKKETLEPRADLTSRVSLQDECKKLVLDAVEDDGRWKSLYPGKRLLADFAKERGLGNPVVLQNAKIKQLGDSRTQCEPAKPAIHSAPGHQVQWAYLARPIGIRPSGS